MTLAITSCNGPVSKRREFAKRILAAAEEHEEYYYSDRIIDEYLTWYYFSLSPKEQNKVDEWENSEEGRRMQAKIDSAHEERLRKLQKRKEQEGIYERCSDITEDEHFLPSEINESKTSTSSSTYWKITQKTWEKEQHSSVSIDVGCSEHHKDYFGFKEPVFDKGKLVEFTMYKKTDYCVNKHTKMSVQNFVNQVTMWAKRYFDTPRVKGSYKINTKRYVPAYDEGNVYYSIEIHVRK